MDNLEEKKVIIDELVSKITEYAEAYYTGTAKVSDEYFDTLVEQLRDIDPNNKILHTTGWGFVPSAHKERVIHPYGLKVGSLDKYKTTEDLLKHFEGLLGWVRISAKLDGLSVVSYYKNGFRTLCLTRGNETEGGLNITEHMDKICPEGKFIAGFTGAIRGEVCISNKTWRNSKYYIKSLEDESINQRNIAAGLINRDYLEESEAKVLDYVIYKILAIENRYFDKISDVDMLLSFTKMRMVDHVYLEKKDFMGITSEKLAKYLEEFRENYPCDGLVITGDVISHTNEDIEIVDYDEVAFKFQAESKIATVKGIEWSATRTGRVVPVVLIEPTNLSGAWVSRVTGFNAEFIKENNLSGGAEVEVCRSGEVIPYIMRVVTPADSPALPTKCPHCNRELKWKGVDLVCDAENESQMPYNALTVLAPIKGVGYRIYSGIVDAYELTSLHNFENFIITVKYAKDLNKITEFIQEQAYLNGEVTTQQITQVLEKLRNPVDAIDLLVACSIPGISEVIARKIITGYPDFLTDVHFGTVNNDKLYKINGIGESIVESIETFRDRVQTMLSTFQDIKLPEKEEKIKTKFKVAITGKLSVKRADFEAELIEHGYEPSGIKKDTKYLITDNPNSNSSKNQLADEWGIEKITEDDFRKQFMCN